eukprot:1156396-Pelagomonas_calceolata.AAC.3
MGWGTLCFFKNLVACPVGTEGCVGSRGQTPQAAPAACAHGSPYCYTFIISGRGQTPQASPAAGAHGSPDCYTFITSDAGLCAAGRGQPSQVAPAVGAHGAQKDRQQAEHRCHRQPHLLGAGGCAATSEQTPQAAPAAGAHGSLKGACGKAGGQGEIEEESQGAAERGPGPSARNGLGAEKGIVVDYQEDVACEGGGCPRELFRLRRKEKKRLYASQLRALRIRFPD